MEIKVTKCLHRIASETQTLKQLVSGETHIFSTKDEAINYVLEVAEPGMHFEFFYYPTPHSKENVGVAQNGFVDCDDYLDGDKLKLEELEKAVIKELSKEFDWERAFYRSRE